MDEPKKDLDASWSPAELPADPKAPYYVTVKFHLQGDTNFPVPITVYPLDERTSLFSFGNTKLVIVSYPGGKGFPYMPEGKGETVPMHCEVATLESEVRVFKGLAWQTEAKGMVVFEGDEGDMWIVRDA